MGILLQDGAPKIAFSCLRKVAKNCRYNYGIHGGYFMVYKPTTISWGPHPVGNFI